MRQFPTSMQQCPTSMYVVTTMACTFFELSPENAMCAPQACRAGAMARAAVTAYLIPKTPEMPEALAIGTERAWARQYPY